MLSWLIRLFIPKEQRVEQERSSAENQRLMENMLYLEQFQQHHR